MAASGQKQPKTLGKKDHVLKYEALLIGHRRGNVKRLPRSTWAIDAALVCVCVKGRDSVGSGLGFAAGPSVCDSPEELRSIAPEAGCRYPHAGARGSL